MPRVDSNFQVSLPAVQSVQPTAGVATTDAGVGLTGDSYQPVTGVVPAAPAETPTVPDTPAAPLTAEETSFVTDGWLPANYAQLKYVLQTQGLDAAKAIVRQGKQGPFAPDYGDPSHMLRSARYIQSHPELARMFKDTKKGDILLVAYNSPTDVIANATRGPFAHALVCTEDGPPPEFIEAIGMTGDQRDPSCNKVRRSTAYETFGGASYRRIRPTENLPAPQAQQAIDGAVQYATRQLGKPYDYTFGEDGVGRSFYCSSLAYYAYTLGAKLPIPINKAAQRDSVILALDSMMDALAPKDRAALMDEIARKVNTNPKPSSQELVKFFVERVLPACSATAGIAKTPEEQARLQAAIAKIQSGQALPRYDVANQQYADAKMAGKFSTPVIGGLRQLWAKTRIMNAFLSDAYHTWDGSGMNKWQTVKATTKMLWAFLPYSEAVSAFLFGRKDSRTEFCSKVLNATGWLRSHKFTSWASGWLPVRGTNNIDDRFISPTDLAWAKLSHNDYNVRPGTSLDQGR